MRRVVRKLLNSQHWPVILGHSERVHLAYSRRAVEVRVCAGKLMGTRFCDVLPRRFIVKVKTKDWQMNLTIDLSERNAFALESQARAAHMPIERYLAYIIERALERQHRRAAENLEQHLDNTASQVPLETTSEAMEAAIEEALEHVRPHRNWQP